MKYYSTNKKISGVSLQDAVVKGLAEDKGLFMPDSIKRLPQSFFDSIETLSFQEIAYTVADSFFGEDVEAEALKKIVYETLNFDVPVVHVNDNIYSLELYHGPTLAFKDVGGRFMARLLGHFLKGFSKEVNNEFLPDEFDDELFLVLKQNDRINIVTACSHRGITNICTTATEHFMLPVGLILGGFHTKNATPKQIRLIIDYFRQLNPMSIGVCHCTGVDKYAAMLYDCEAHLFYNYTGNVIDIEHN